MASFCCVRTTSPLLWWPPSVLWGLSVGHVSHAIAVTVIVSKIDYCSSLLRGLPSIQICRYVVLRQSRMLLLQSWQTQERDIKQTILKELHWLPAAERIQHKVPLGQGVCSPPLIGCQSHPSTYRMSILPTPRLAVSYNLKVPLCPSKSIGLQDQAKSFQ